MSKKVKTIPNDIVLRPRFQLELSDPKDEVLKAFEKAEIKPFLVKRLDEHIFIKFDEKHRHFWSPQLHIEIDTIDTKNCRLYGVFGPNPTLWTFFMFLHFGVATLFIILGIWAYSSASLNKDYGVQLGVMVFLVVLWLVLYAFGRAGKKTGRPQTQQLYQFMTTILT